MRKEQYVELKNDLESKIKDLKNTLIKVKEDYLDSYGDFEIGEKVKIITPSRDHRLIAGAKKVILPKSERFAFVKGFYINFNDDVVPSFSKCKKDGTVSQHSDHAGRSEIIEKLKQI